MKTSYKSVTLEFCGTSFSSSKSYNYYQEPTFTIEVNENILGENN